MFARTLSHECRQHAAARQRLGCRSKQHQQLFVAAITPVESTTPVTLPIVNTAVQRKTIGGGKQLFEKTVDFPDFSTKWMELIKETIPDINRNRVRSGAQIRSG
jgi:hypothetical protein